MKAEVALVTGARGKLGPVWCAALARAGAEVIAVDIEDADVTDTASLLSLRQRLDRPPTVLVNNAGIDQSPEAAIGGEDFLRVLDVNLAGTHNCCVVFGEAMVAAGRGAIVNIGSLYASVAPIPQLYDHLPGFVKPAAYGASKAGVVQLTKYFARLWGPRGVRVNTLSPGGLLAEQDAEFLEKYGERTPLGRMAEPEDLTGPLVFLASDASRYVTGHELRVDGGFSA